MAPAPAQASPSLTPAILVPVTFCGPIFWCSETSCHVGGPVESYCFDFHLTGTVTGCLTPYSQDNHVPLACVQPCQTGALPFSFTDCLQPGCYNIVLCKLTVCPCFGGTTAVFLNGCTCFKVTCRGVSCVQPFSAGVFEFAASDPLIGNGFINVAATSVPEVNAAAAALPVATGLGILMVVADRRRRQS
ncbi:MAG TPA: hypothetical protein VGO93_22260 [Candidatus Xenobia bacterium]